MTQAEIANFDHNKVAALWAKALDTKGEASVVLLVRAALVMGSTIDFPGIPMDLEVDNVQCEYRLPHGRADFCIFHADGSATLIEAKDGAGGMKHVLSGLGQVLMYALDMSMQSGRPQKIRKALLWSSTGDLVEDVMIEMCCERAGVIPMQFGPLKPQLDSCERAVYPQGRPSV
jgi:hypothetical protein